MKSTKDGKFSTTIDLQTGREYHFRYLINEDQWENDPEADRQEVTIYGDSHNSILIL